MEIKLNTSIDAVVKAAASGKAAVAAAQDAPATSFEQTESLNRALAATPDVRGEAVRRGREAANSATYPPEQTIRRISHLLALNLETADAF